MTKQNTETPRLETKEATDYDESVELLQLIGGTSTVKKLIAALGDVRISIRRGAAKVLLEMKPAPTQLLIEALSAQNSIIRGKAAELLGQLGDLSAVQPLICSLQDPEWYVRANAAQALGCLEDSKAAQALVDLICADNNVFMLAAKALKNINDNQSKERLANALLDDDPGVRRRAMEALNLLDNSYMIDFLMDSIQSNDRDVSHKAAQTLRQVDDVRIIERLQAILNKKSDIHIHRVAEPVLQEIRNRYTRSLLDALNNRESQIGKIAESYCKNDPDLSALSGSHLEDAVTMLIIRDLGRLGDCSSVEPLLALRGQQNTFIYNMIHDALIMIGEANKEKLLADSNGQDPHAQAEAAELLSLLAAREAVVPSSKTKESPGPLYRKVEPIGRKPIFKRPVFLTTVTICLILILIAVGAIHYFSSLTPGSTSSSYPFSQSLVFSDSLKSYNRDHGWDIRKFDHSSCVFVNGAYHANAVASSPAICIARSTVFKNFTYEVQMKLVSGDFGGIIFRYIEPESAYFYAFGTSQEGRYMIIPVDPQSPSGDIEGQSTAIVTGYNQSNVLAVVASGKSLRFYINKHEITEISGGTINQGSIGVFALDAVNPTDVQFSNARVWKLPN